MAYIPKHPKLICCVHYDFAEILIMNCDKLHRLKVKGIHKS